MVNDDDIKCDGGAVAGSECGWTESKSESWTPGPSNASGSREKLNAEAPRSSWWVTGWSRSAADKLEWMVGWCAWAGWML